MMKVDVGYQLMTVKYINLSIKLFIYDHIPNHEIRMLVNNKKTQKSALFGVFRYCRHSLN